MNSTYIYFWQYLCTHSVDNAVDLFTLELKFHMEVNIIFVYKFWRR